MFVVSEEVAARSVSIDDAIDAVRAAFIALALGTAEVFAVAGGTASDPANRFAAKSGRIDGLALGIKIGTYWPGNVERNLVAHASTVLLLDDETGFPLAVVGASCLTALRTAAADAAAADVLARETASKLLVIGTGHQAYYDALGISRVRELSEVMVWGRDSARAEELARRLSEDGLPAGATPLEAGIERAEIISTVTSSDAALVGAAMVRPGTHIGAMGADSPGKAEIDVELISAARCFADVVDQAVTIGEFQHAFAAGAIKRESITPIGDVLSGNAPGRQSDDEITIFDSSGTAIQDLAVCARALDVAVAHNEAIRVG